MGFVFFQTAVTRGFRYRLNYKHIYRIEDVGVQRIPVAFAGNLAASLDLTKRMTVPFCEMTVLGGTRTRAKKSSEVTTFTTPLAWSASAVATVGTKMNPGFCASAHGATVESRTTPVNVSTISSNSIGVHCHLSMSL